VGRTAVVTGATQGLGLALVGELSRRLDEDDLVYLTGRDPARVERAIELLPTQRAQVRTELLDVSSEAAVRRVADALRDRHDGVDLVFSNAYRRMGPDDDQAAEIEDYIDANNLGTTRMLRAFGPLLNDGARMLVLASTMGTLHYLAPVLHARFDELDTLEDVDDAVRRWGAAVQSGAAPSEGWPAFINIPSKIGQVSAVRTMTRTRCDSDLEREILISACCPGMIDTGASRPWFDVSRAQTPEQAAARLLDVVLQPHLDPALHGELIRFGEILPWKP
jgi:NAD(P)-dependent dehydrogenase (short-subunit alcohol dehydrogenase family)